MNTIIFTIWIISAIILVFVSLFKKINKSQKNISESSLNQIDSNESSKEQCCPSCGCKLSSPSSLFCSQCGNYVKFQTSSKSVSRLSVGQTSSHEIFIPKTDTEYHYKSSDPLKSPASSDENTHISTKNISQSSIDQISPVEIQPPKTDSEGKLYDQLNEAISSFKKTHSKSKKTALAQEIVEYCKVISEKKYTYDSRLTKDILKKIKSQYQSFLNCGLLESKEITPTTRNKLDKFRTYDGYVVLDVETTGLSAQTEKIIEIALLKIRPLKEPEKYSSFVNPNRSLNSYITELTGITNSDLISAPVFSEISDDVLSFIDGLPLVAHNASFDVSFLEHEINKDYSFLYVDTLKMARICFPYLRNHKLQTLIQKLHLGKGQDHRALSDAFYTNLLFKKCLEELEETFKS